MSSSIVFVSWEKPNTCRCSPYVIEEVQKTWGKIFSFAWIFTRFEILVLVVVDKGSREGILHISSDQERPSCLRVLEQTYIIYVLRIVHLVFCWGSNNINNIIAIILVSRVRHWLHVKIVKHCYWRSFLITQNVNSELYFLCIYMDGGKWEKIRLRLK